MTHRFVIARQPGHHEFYWRIKGTATCVPKEYVKLYQTDDYYNEYKNAELDWAGE